MCIALRAIAVELFLPFHHISLAAVLRDDPVDTVAALASTLGAFDAQHLELALDVAKDEVSPLRHNGGTPNPYAAYPISRAYRFDL